jgi:hypothetical protein
VSSKSLTNRLYHSSSQLVVSCLVAVDSLQISFKSTDVDVLRTDCTVDINVISRLLSFIITTCSLLIYQRPQNTYGSYDVEKHRSLPMPCIHRSLSSIDTDNEIPAEIACMTKV